MPWSEALAIEACHPATIHLLLTDVVMPQMSGTQLAQHLERIRPGIKVLYLSGYTDEAIVQHNVIDTNVAFLQKPFSPTALAKKVRDTLASPG
jgi:DNA-binding NtrC family response regulator